MAVGKPTLRVRGDDNDALSGCIKKRDRPHQRFPGFEGAFVVLTAPEGTKLFAFDEDFLGENYEVDESDDTSAFPTQ